MEIAVKAKSAHLIKDESLVQNSEKLYIVEFAFDQSWDGYTKSAIFEAGGVQQSPVALTDNRCTLDQLKMLALRTKGEINKVDTRVTELSGRVDELVTAGGEPNVLVGVKVNGTALAIAEKMVDILIATGATNGTLAVNGVNVAVKGLAALAYKAQVSESDLDTALKAVLDAKASGADLATLIGEDTGKSARTIANEELTKQLIPESAKDSLDTLTEIAQWIQDHPDDASAMNAAIAKLNSIVAGIGGDSDTYATIIAAIDGKIAEAINGIEIATDTEVEDMLDEVFGAAEDAEGGQEGA